MIGGFARRLLVGLTLAALVASGLGSAALAAEEDHGWSREPEPDPEIARRPVPSEKTRERHARAIELLFEDRLTEARQELDKIYFSRLNPVEQAMIHQDYAYIASAEENREEARRRFQLAIDSGGLYEKEEDAVFKIAMLWMQDEEWKNASDTLEKWFTMVDDPNANSYYILALTYYQQERYDEALVPARKAIELADVPKESWLQLMLGIELLRKDYEAAVPVVEQLIAYYPKRDYFMNLSTVHGAMGDYEEAAIPMQLAHLQGLLTEDEHLRRLGQLLLFLNLPFRAAEVLDEGIEEDVIDVDSDVLAMLSNSWIAAREFEEAVAPLERAASLSENGDLYVRLAQVHVQRGNWSGATDALRKALDKGGLAETGNAHLLMGIALYSAERPGEARRWFRNAQEFEPTEAESSAWLEHIDQEMAAQAAREGQATGG